MAAFLFLLCLVSIGIAIAALRRGGGPQGLLDRIAKLEVRNGVLTKRIWELEREVRGLRGSAHEPEGTPSWPARGVAAAGEPEGVAPPSAGGVEPRAVPDVPEPTSAASGSSSIPAGLPGSHPPPAEPPAPVESLGARISSPRVPSAVPERGRGAASPLPPSPPGALRADWEHWLGVRGAAVLGGIALALAGLLFFRYSIEKGYIQPPMRVALGVLVGIGCVAGSERGLRRRYPGTANALAGAGIVILYAAFWAAKVRYRLVGTEVAFPLMVLVTAAGCLLAVRHGSMLVALLGLAGGFATPLLLATGTDRPISLFGYILLLDLGFLAIARARRWPVLAMLSLAATVLYQALWIGARMGPNRLVLGLGILAVFAVLYLFAGRGVPADERKAWWLSQCAAVLLPFAFALYFAGSTRFGPHLYPVAMLLALLSGAASWMGRAMGRRQLGLGAAAGSVAVIAAWILTRSSTPALAWEAVGIAFALALVFHLFVEWEPDAAGSDGPALAAIVSAVGLTLFLMVAAGRNPGVSPWPWLAGWLALAGLLVRHASFPGRAPLQAAAAIGVGLGLWVCAAVRARAAVYPYRVLHDGSPWIVPKLDAAFPSLPVFAGALVVVAILFQIVALLRREPKARRWAEHSAAIVALILLFAFLTVPHLRELAPSAFLGVSLALGMLVMLAATRLGSGPWAFVAMWATALTHFTWAEGVSFSGPPDVAALAGLAVQSVAVLTFTGWPFLVAGRFQTDRWAWTAAALAGPVWFLSLRRLYEAGFGKGTIGLLPVLLGVLSLAAAWRAREIWPKDRPLRKSTLVWFSAVALGFASVAIPLQLEKEWITIGWALEGLAVSLLWRRLDHPGLKYFGLALLAATAVRLVANPAVLGYYPRSSWRVLNWLAYTYLVPAAALVGTSLLLREDEVPRARDWERPLYAPGRPVGAVGCGLAAIAVVFVWLNLAIADWFSTEPALRISFERMPARDLATSIAWALYALVLLGIGMARRSRALRWASLVLMIPTIGKAFLYDLGHLHDLYRVMSLLGLAVSLILISLLYQRFVFRKELGE